MNSENALGDVFVCSPTPNPTSHIGSLASTSMLTLETEGQDFPVESISKPKKKRSKPKSRIAIRELNIATTSTISQGNPLDSVASASGIHETVELQNLMKSLDMTSTTESDVPVEKSKRVRIRRKKAKSDKEISANEDDDFQTQPIGVFVNEAVAVNRGVKPKNKKIQDKPSDNEKSGNVNGDFQTQPIGVFVNEAVAVNKGVKPKNKKLQDKLVQSPQKTPNKENTSFSSRNFFTDELHFSGKQKRAGERKSTSKKNKEKDTFFEYLSAEEVEEGLKNKTMIAGPIRINPRCYKEAYVSCEGYEKDIVIEGLGNRNRALEGDDVVVMINPPEAWKENHGQKTGIVVHIRDMVHSRSCIGKLPSTVELNKKFVVFSPRDSRVPRIKIPLNDRSLPPDYVFGPSSYAEILFSAKITGWTEVNYAQGEITKTVGKCGELEVETLAIMLENNLDPEPMNPLLNMFFPALPYTIPDEEIAKRCDLRKECIFTIDPLTARDLDDAVSAKRLDNGNIEVGIHISDVSHFLQPNTLLDHTVSKRATTVYLVQRVYHMLPVELCLLCSLSPGEDKLAFSVFAELTPDARVVSHRFARTVINSCTKLAYEHAQVVIDNPEKEVTAEDFPEIFNGFTAEDCADAIRELFKLSKIMRKRRFDSGALKVDQPKLCFRLDPETNIPLSSFVYENKESHRLIEEFMLLANGIVAEHIYSVFPKLAFLRQHSPPRMSMMVELKKSLESCGINIDITDAGTIHSSMQKYSCALPGEDQVLAWARYVVLNNLCAKPMMRANYFCPSDENNDMHHYALNVPCYTHFTSPIRRYADVMVHRLLASSLNLAPKPNWTNLQTKRIATICNRQKLWAKMAGDQSSMLYLALYLREPVECEAAVLDVKDRSFDVIVRDFGILLRVYTDPLPVKVEFQKDDDMPQLYIKWSNDGSIQLIQLFTVVRIEISRAKDSLKLSAVLLQPTITN